MPFEDIVEEKSTGSHVLLTQEVADMLQMSPCSIRRLVKEKKIPYLRIGRSLRFPREQIEAWLRNGTSEVHCVEINPVERLPKVEKPVEKKRRGRKAKKS